MCWQVPPFSTHVLAAQRWREPQLVRLLLWVLSTCMDACAIVPAPLGGWGGSSGTLYLAWDGSGDSRVHAGTHGGDSRRRLTAPRRHRWRTALRTARDEADRSLPG